MNRNHKNRTVNARKMKKMKKEEEIRVSLQKLKCAKTDSPTCKWYWLTHRQVNLQTIYELENFRTPRFSRVNDNANSFKSESLINTISGLASC